MQSIRWSCQLAFRSSNNTLTFANGSRRAFSRTCRRSARGLPVFLEPSSNALSSLLSTLNTKLLLPYHFTREQQRLVFRVKNKAKLEAEPVEITVGDVTLPLEHLDRHRLPNRWQTFCAILKESKTEQDCENVVRMLEGFHNAGIKLYPNWKNMAIRILISKGSLHVVLKGLQRAKSTNLTLQDNRLLGHVLRGIHDKAEMSDWDKEDTVKALRMAKQVTELLEEPEHHSPFVRGNRVIESDHRGDPAVIALPTELAALLAERYDGDMEEVKRFAGRLVSALKQTQYHTKVDAIASACTKTEADFQNGTLQASACMEARQDLLQVVMIWHALKMSRSVLGSDMPEALEAEQFESRILQALKKSITAMPGLLTRDGTTMSGTNLAEVKESFARCGCHL